MKKYISTLLCTVLILSLCGAFCAQEPVLFTIEGASGAVGQTVTVKLTVSESSQITNMLLSFSYNNEYLRFRDYAAGEVIKGGLYEFNSNFDDQIKFAYVANAGIEAGGTVFSITFEIIKAVQSDTEAALTLNVNEAETAEGPIKFNVNAGTVMIDSALSLARTDANGDGKLDSNDIQFVKNYLLGIDTLAADFDLNDDGVCDISDLLKLKQML